MRMRVPGLTTSARTCREQKTAQKQVKEAAKRGDVASARLLAKELVRTRKATTQLYTHKAHMIAMGTQLQEQLAMVKVRPAAGVCDLWPLVQSSGCSASQGVHR